MRRLGAEVVEVRTPEGLAGLDGLGHPRRRVDDDVEVDRVLGGSSRRCARTTRRGGRSSAPAPG
ncbi:MAG: hypothetical protein QM729_00050 [Solirubrobacterales bacterium]